MTESMRRLRNVCAERGKWLNYDDMTSSEKDKVRFVTSDLSVMLVKASNGEIEQAYYNVVEIAGGRDEYVSVYTYNEMLAFVDVTGDSKMALVRDVMRVLEGI